MFRNNLILGLRALTKFKGYSAINLVGLSLGLAAGTLILLYVMDEFSFDKFHQNGERIYRVETSLVSTKDGGSQQTLETNGWPVGSVLRNEFPEVEAVVYERSASQMLINYEGKRIRENSIYASPEFFTIFSFPLIEGNRGTALNQPFSIVISRKLEKKYFGNQPALAKTLTLGDSLTFIVTGVMEDIPSNSHIQADAVLSFSTFEKQSPEFSYETGWGNINMHNYVMLREHSDYSAFAKKAEGIYMEKAGTMMKSWGVTARVAYVPVQRLYLQENESNGLGPKGSESRIYMVSGVALLVILLACINFVNLATARSLYRAKEVGLRKVAGSTRGSLIAQFLLESLLVTVLSFAIAVLLIASSLPMFNELLNKSYDLHSFIKTPVLTGILGVIIAISFLAGYYPALVLSNLKPALVLKGKMQSSDRGIHLRRVLVVVQFVISVSLVSGTFVVLDQLDFMQRESLGFAKDEIFVINAARVNSVRPNAFETFRQQISSQAFAGDVSLANAIPGHQGWNGQVAYPEGHEGEQAVSTEYIAADENYVGTLGLNIIAGRNFDIRRESDKKNGLLINETTVKEMGWSKPEDAIGKKITSPSGYPAGEVIGVVQNYHQLGLQQGIGPIVIDYNPESAYLFAIRYKASDTKNLITTLEQRWKADFPGYDFNYFFLDQDFQKQYQSEQQLGLVFTVFSALTILIAVIGLFGLVSFMTVTRTREIGVRKVLGATPLSIASLLSREFVFLVMTANVIALPLAWLLADKWLQNFASRMSLTPGLFLLTGVIALTVSLLAVSVQTLRAALANPVLSLRHE